MSFTLWQWMQDQDTSSRHQPDFLGVSEKISLRSLYHCHGSEHKTISYITWSRKLFSVSCFSKTLLLHGTWYRSPGICKGFMLSYRLSKQLIGSPSRHTSECSHRQWDRIGPVDLCSQWFSNASTSRGFTCWLGGRKADVSLSYLVL